MFCSESEATGTEVSTSIGDDMNAGLSFISAGVQTYRTTRTA